MSTDSRPFNEAMLRADVGRVWGAFGAHMDLLNEIIRQRDRALEQIRRLEALPVTLCCICNEPVWPAHDLCQDVRNRTLRYGHRECLERHTCEEAIILDGIRLTCAKHWQDGPEHYGYLPDGRVISWRQP